MTDILQFSLAVGRNAVNNAGEVLKSNNLKKVRFLACNKRSYNQTL